MLRFEKIMNIWIPSMYLLGAGIWIISAIDIFYGSFKLFEAFLIWVLLGIGIFVVTTVITAVLPIIVIAIIWIFPFLYKRRKNVSNKTYLGDIS